jgi:lysophospholipase
MEKVMKAKVKYRILAVVLVLAVAVGYLCFPTRTVKAPQNAVELDLTRTENADFYVSEDNYEWTMENVVEPYLDQYKATGYFKGDDGNDLYYEQFINEGSKAHIVVAHGYTDAACKFDEMVYYFLKSGYSVSLMEYRGHGYSYRNTDDMSKVTIGSFDEYLDDFKLFMSDVVEPAVAEDEKLFIYAHSMGGGLAAMLLEEDSTMFDAAVLSSPMMEILFDGIPANLVGLITNAYNLFGLGEEYILGNGPYDGEYSFEDSSYTCEVKYAYIQKQKENSEYYRTNGGSFAWLKAAVNATKSIRKNADKYTTDTLLFQAGLDSTVGANGQNEFATKASNVQLITVSGSKHNILFAQNSIFIPYMNTILEFFEEHL